MNKERIKELAKKAQAYADQQWLEVGDPNWENLQEVFAEDYNKKFAELIVRECLSIIENSEGDSDYASWKIKKDFGIET